MDKIKVNNQVVSMRKFVKQAKIHALHKCTKQIKFLEKRKDNEEKMAKTKRKLQRLLEEVNIFKKIKPDSVSKLALSKAKDWKAVLAEKNIPLEERCFAMLANHPPVQESVEKFCNNNSELVSKVPELIKEWEEKKSRSSQINKKKQKSKQDNVKNPNKVPIGNKNNFQKSNEAQIKCESTESLENLLDSSHTEQKSIQNDITEQNLKIRKTNKRKKSSDKLDLSRILCSPPKKELLATDVSKSNRSDGCFSNYSDTASHQLNQSKKKIPIQDETNSYKSYKNDIDSLSDSSDITNHQISLSKVNIPAKDKTKSDMSCKISDQCAVNHQTDLLEKEIQFKKEGINSGEIKKIELKSNKEENSEKFRDIRSKLLEIAMSKTEVQNKTRNKHFPVVHQLNASLDTDSDGKDSVNAHKMLDDSGKISSTKTKFSNSTKPELKSKMKAITMLDLNQLQDLDEIPIERSDNDSEDETDKDLGKQKKDTFFLRDGEPVSETDEDESIEKESVRKQDYSLFKKKSYSNFNKREQRDNLFQKKFDKHSVNGRNSNFRERGLVKNELSFKNNKQNFKQTFDNSKYRQNKDFSFPSKDKFSSRNTTNNFSRSLKVKSLSENQSKDVKRNTRYSPKSNLNNSQKIKCDDKPLHPSWEAKKKLKEAANLKFQGKRMVFND